MKTVHVLSDLVHNRAEFMHGYGSAGQVQGAGAK